MSTTDLKLETWGTIPKPGPYGRIIRLLLGGLCLNLVVGLWSIRNHLMAETQALNSLLMTGLIFGLFLVSYIVNIGYSRSWEKWPAVISAAVFIAIAGIGYATTGKVETIWLGRAIHVWSLYIFVHLGTSFVVAAIMGAPGCEMRALYYFYSRVTGTPTKEHRCPIGPLPLIDKWETTRGSE